MKICFLTHNYPRYEGDYSGFFIKDLALSLSMRGHVIKVLTPHAEGSAFQEKIAGVDIIRFVYGNKEDIAYTGNMHGLILNPSKLCQFLQYFKSSFSHTRRIIQSCDVLHVNWMVPSGLIASLIPSKKKIITLHGTDVRILSNSIFPFFAKNLLDRYLLTTTVSDFLRDEINKWGYSGEKLVVPMTGNLDCFINFEKEIKTKPVNFLTVSRLSKQKNVEVVLKSMRLLKMENFEFKYTIVGDGEDRQRLENLSKSLSLGDEVIFTGSVQRERVRDFLKANDVFILPSFKEGFGISALEAMFSGLALVVAKSGSLVGFVEDGKCGYFFDPFSWQDCVRVLKNVILDEESTKKIARQGRQKAVDSFSFDIQIDLWERTYAKINALK
ncbi:glycosyltransferase family 4 protein [candidate division WOR-3 bacterium]|nr:glycosyltransferase family 4 protein [candidate division WOR-3 bacterium]